MRGAVLRIAMLMLVASAISGCTRGLTIRVDYDQRGAYFSFWTNGWFSQREKPCIWLFQVTDEKTNRTVVERKNANKCVRLEGLRLSPATPGLTGKGDGSSLTPGVAYRASLIAEGEQGRSERWIAQ